MSLRFSSYFAFIILQCLFVFHSISAAPNIGSPEDVVACLPCCDGEGNSIPSHPVCGCGPVNSCGECSSDESTCSPSCRLFDCANNPLPNAANFCHYDVDGDNYITREDANLVRDEVNRGGSGPLYDINQDGNVTALDALFVINFLNSPENGTLIDDCGVCGGPGRGACGSCDPNIRDNGCGCGNPGPSGCDNRCGSTAQVDICGVCGGNGTSCQQQCKFYNINTVSMPGRDAVGGGTTVFSGAGSNLTCIQDLLNRFNLSSNYTPRGDVWDEELAKYLAHRFEMPGFDIRPNQKGVIHPRWNGLANLLMDANCNPISARNVNLSDVCGTLQFRYLHSPISLLLDSEAINESHVLLKFKLNPYRESQYVMWRASDKFPLLVYDPDKTGEIKDGKQLFGSWTFGGKHNFASLVDAALPSSVEWENGFEPLKTLDKNGDNNLNGDELESLALWFDSNRDGISQAGEVKRLKDISVTNLSLTPVQKLGILNDLAVNKGYSRSVKGRIEHGPMIDWFTRTYDNPTEALAYESLRIFETKAGKNSLFVSDETNIFPKNSVEEGSEQAKVLSTENFAGIYEWGIKNSDTDGGEIMSSGLITIQDMGEKIRGHLYISIPFTEVKTGRSFNNLLGNTFEGEKYFRKEDNKVVARFKVTDQNGESITELFRENLKGDLSGQTTTDFGVEKGGPQKVSYNWTARVWRPRSPRH